MKTPILLCLLLAFGTAGAQANTDTTDGANAAPPSQTAGALPADKPAPVAATSERKICKLERELGSQRVKRVCHNREELDAQSENARKSMADAQRR